MNQTPAWPFLAMAKPVASTTSAFPLRDRVAFCIALEEMAIEALSRALAEFRAWAPAEEVEAYERLIRTHRVGILKHRAIMGAVGIDV